MLGAESGYPSVPAVGDDANAQHLCPLEHESANICAFLSKERRERNINVRDWLPPMNQTHNLRYVP